MVRVSEVSTYWMEDDSPLVPVYGSWLRDFGFEPGTKVVIDVIQGQITVRVADHED